MENIINKKAHDSVNYRRGEMQKEMIIKKLRENGLRITEQRKIILDIILKEKCTSCKEIYFKVSKVNKDIGPATVYRMLHTLEEIGAISRNDIFKVAYCNECKVDNLCTVELDNERKFNLSAEEWHNILQAGLRTCGYISKEKVLSVVIKECECNDI